MFTRSKKTLMREILPKPTHPPPPIQIKVSTNPMKKQKRGGKAQKVPVAAAVNKPQIKTPYRKKKITGALREAVWLKTMGRTFEGKCPVTWCSNTITVFDFQSGHNIPESKGGETKLPNLIAICSRCNFSMGNTYTIDEWNALHASPEQLTLTLAPQVQEPPPKQKTFWQRVFCCFRQTTKV